MSAVYTEPEGMVLSSLFLAPNRLYELTLQESDFSSIFGRKVFRAIGDVLADGPAVDLVSVAERLAGDPVVTASDIAHLTSLSPTAANIDYYADLVADAAARRELVKLGSELSATAEQQSATDTIHWLDTRLQKLQREERSDDGIAAENQEAIDDLVDRYDHGGRHAGIASGFPKLDWLTGGLEPERYYIVGGRPGSGKTLALLAMLISACRAGFRVGFVNLENPIRPQILHRLYSRLSNVKLSSIRRATLTSGEFVAVKKAKAEIDTWHLYRHGAADGADERSIRGRVLRWKRRYGLDLLLVDYAQLIRAGGSSDYERATNASLALKRIAGEQQVPVVAAVQLNRAGVGKPKLEDLKSSGQFEQDADVAAFLWDNGERRVLSVLKNRDGSLGDIPLYFDGSRAMVGEVAG